MCGVINIHLMFIDGSAETDDHFITFPGVTSVPIIPQTPVISVEMAGLIRKQWSGQKRDSVVPVWTTLTPFCFKLHKASFCGSNSSFNKIEKIIFTHSMLA